MPHSILSLYAYQFPLSHKYTSGSSGIESARKEKLGDERRQSDM